MPRLPLLPAILLMAACSESHQLASPSASQRQEALPVAFSTYMGRGATTRGGAYEAINNAKLADPEYGFGVFAYYTGNTPYADYRTQDATPRRYPNFMYNERIISDGLGAWQYASPENTKYWPNEVSTYANDDQNDNHGNDPATSPGENGGKVSFFAYGPYTATDDYAKTEGIDGNPVLESDHEGTRGGIVAFSGNLYNGDAALKKYSDPYLLYKLSSDNSKQVDLLWGTTGTNSPNILGESQPGMRSENLPEFVLGQPFTNDYSDPQHPIIRRPDYYVNTDLTKQKTNGTVHFHFKHALSKIGGSYVGSADGSDEDPSTPTNGLLVILDIDKMGEEQGGSLQPYAEGPQGSTLYNTKVTLSEVKLENDKQLTPEGRDALLNGEPFNFYDSQYTELLSNFGIFNLATGVWHGQETHGTTTRTQTILPSDISQDNPDSNPDADSSKDAVMNRNLAEPSRANWTNAHTRRAFEQLPIGVTTIAKNVYQSETQPFVFIPGTHPIITITIDFTVRTYDPKLAQNYSEVRQKITKRLYILDEIEASKQYNVLMHLSLTGVKFTATVSDWEVKNANADTTIDPGGGQSPVQTYDQDVEHIYLPINVK